MAERKNVHEIRSAQAERLLADPLLLETLNNMRDALLEDIERMSPADDPAAVEAERERCRMLRTLAAFRQDLFANVLMKDRAESEE